jgi:DNA-binding NtrC family response regulator
VSAPPLVVVVDQPSPRRDRLQRELASIGFRQAKAGASDALFTVAHHQPDVVIVSAAPTTVASALECLQRLHATFPLPKYIFVTVTSSEDVAISALQAGAQQYLKDPWTPAMLQEAIRALLPREVDAVPVDALIAGDQLVGRSQAVRQLRLQIARVAPTNSNVLVLGETGTGKEMVAELIHANSRRASRPFVCLNTAAIPDALLENELFGHERGAFTGATTTQPGKLLVAHGGTAFFDEIGDVSLPMQAKLLRAIESKTAYRLGGTRSVPIDVRILAATNHDLQRESSDGRFRQDLYYRLNVVRIELPPLRERRDDIPLLIQHYLRHFNHELGRSVRGLSPRALDTLRAYDWPGNVRELRNVIEALLVHLAPETTGVVDVPPEVMRQLAFAVGAPVSERERLLNALAATNWNKSRAASQLRCSRMTLYRKMSRYKLVSER